MKRLNGKVAIITAGATGIRESISKKYAREGSKVIVNGFTEDPVNLLVHDSIRQKRVKVYYRQVLDMHKLTPEQFNRSYSYYEAHPNSFKEIYDMMSTVVANDKNMLDINVRRQEYVTNRRNLLPVNNNSLISVEQDTLIPFVKKNKRGINFDHLPPKHVPMPKLAKPKK